MDNGSDLGRLVHIGMLGAVIFALCLFLIILLVSEIYDAVNSKNANPPKKHKRKIRILLCLFLANVVLLVFYFFINE